MSALQMLNSNPAAKSPRGQEMSRAIWFNSTAYEAGQERSRIHLIVVKTDLMQVANRHIQKMGFVLKKKQVGNVASL